MVFDEEEKWNWEQKGSTSATLKWNDDFEEHVDTTPNVEVQEQVNNNEEDGEDHSTSVDSGTSSGVRSGISSSANSGTSSPVNDQSSNSSSSNNGSPNTSPVQRRIRRQHAYMEDFVSGEGLSDEDEMHQVVMFAATNDTTNFEEAYKYAEWRESMDLEMQAIEKNKTWELTSLLKDLKLSGSNGFSRQSSMKRETWIDTRRV